MSKKSVNAFKVHKPGRVTWPFANLLIQLLVIAPLVCRFDFFVSKLIPVLFTLRLKQQAHFYCD